MKADEWADSTYNHERAKSVARKLVESCGLTPEQVRARALVLSPPPAPSPWGHNRGVPLSSPLRIHGLTEDGESVVLSTDIVSGCPRCGGMTTAGEEKQPVVCFRCNEKDDLERLAVKMRERGESEERIALTMKHARFSSDIGQQGAGPPGAAPGRDDLLPDSDPEAA